MSVIIFRVRFEAMAARILCFATAFAAFCSAAYRVDAKRVSTSVESRLAIDAAKENASAQIRNPNDAAELKEEVERLRKRVAELEAQQVDGPQYYDLWDDVEPDEATEGVPSKEHPTPHKIDIGHNPIHVRDNMHFVVIFFFIFLMSVLYLANSKHRRIQVQIFKVFSVIIAIFLALFIEKALHNLWMRGFVAVVLNGPFDGDELTMVVFFVPYYLLISVGSRHFRQQPEYNFAIVEGVITHLAAFQAIEMFAEPQEDFAKKILASTNSNSALLLYYFLWCPGCVLLFKAMSYFTHHLRLRLDRLSEHESDVASAETLASDGTAIAHHGEGEGPGGHDWKDVAREAEDDMSAIVFGFMFGRVFLWACVAPGTVIPIDFDAKSGWNSANRHYASLFIVMTVILVWLCHNLHRCLAQHDMAVSRVAKFVQSFQIHLLMSIAWSFMLVLRWLVHYTLEIGLMDSSHRDAWQSIVAKKFLCFMVWWFIFVVSFLIVATLGNNGMLSEGLADKTVLSLSMATAVMIEKMYSHAVDAVIREMDELGGQNMSVPTKLLIQIALCVALLTLTFPAWLEYIVPTAMKPMRKHTKYFAFD